MTKERCKEMGFMEWCFYLDPAFSSLTGELKADVERRSQHKFDWAQQPAGESVLGALKARLVKGSEYVEDQLRGGKTLADVKDYLTTIYKIMDDITAFNNLDWKVLQWDYKKKFTLDDLHRLGDYSFIQAEARA